LQVIVRDNNVDQALRVLKKKLQREGVFREMKRRKAYEKPSERKTREKAEAIRRARKAARKLAQREGLVPMPKRRDARPVAHRCPGRSEFAANTFLTLCVMHNGAALAVCPSLARGRGRPSSLLVLIQIRRTLQFQLRIAIQRAHPRRKFDIVPT
jgi:small subunit ribosomal protein S21